MSNMTYVRHFVGPPEVNVRPSDVMRMVVAYGNGYDEVLDSPVRTVAQVSTYCQYLQTDHAEA